MTTAMTSSEYRSSVTVPIQVVTLISSRPKSTASAPSFRRSASVTNFRSTYRNTATGKRTDAMVGRTGTTVDRTTECALPEDGLSLNEDWLVAKYRHVFAGQGGSLCRPFRRSSSATMMRSSSGGYSALSVHNRQSLADYSNRKLSVSMQPVVAFGSTIRHQCRATSATISTSSPLYRETLKRRPETAVGRHTEQLSTTDSDDADAESATVSRRIRSLVVHLVGSEQSRENEFIIEDGDDDDDKQEEEDVDSGFNRDESLTRDSSTSGQPIDERINKQQEVDDSHETDRHSRGHDVDDRLPRDHDAEADGNGVQFDEQHRTSSSISSVALQSLVTSTVTSLVSTPADGWDTHCAMKTLEEDGANSREEASNVTAITAPPSGVFSSMSNEARQALFETRSDMRRRTMDSHHVGLSDTNTGSEVVNDEPQNGQSGKLQTRNSIASRSQRPKSVSGTTRRNQDRTVQRQKADLMSGSAVSSSAWRRHRATPTTSRYHVTEQQHRFAQRSAVRDPSRRDDRHDVIPFSIDSRLAAVDASSSRPLSTSFGPRSSTGSIPKLRASDKDHVRRLNPDKDPESPIAQVASEDSHSAVVADFRITPATYDSRYADMMAAAALDERWRERGRSNGVGRWNENPEYGVDRLIRDLAVAKCSDWLAKQQEQQYPHPQCQLEKKRFIVMNN